MSGCELDSLALAGGRSHIRSGDAGDVEAATCAFHNFTSFAACAADLCLKRLTRLAGGWWGPPWSSSDDESPGGLCRAIVGKFLFFFLLLFFRRNEARGMKSDVERKHAREGKKTSFSTLFRSLLSIPALFVESHPHDSSWRPRPSPSSQPTHL